MDMKEKLAELVHDARMNALWHNAQKPDEYITDMLMEDGVTVQEWISVNDHTPKELGEYNIAQKHWLDGHLEAKKGTWNGVEWFVDGRESLMVAYWIPPLPLPPLPKGE